MRIRAFIKEENEGKTQGRFRSAYKRNFPFGSTSLAPISTSRVFFHLQNLKFRNCAFFRCYIFIFLQLTMSANEKEPSQEPAVVDNSEPMEEGEFT